MVVTGALVGAFVVFHLLHFTAGVIDPSSHAATDAAGRHDVQAMMSGRFGKAWLVAVYLGAMALITGHLWHGAESLTKTLGLHSRSWAGAVRWASRALVLALGLGFASIPVAFAAGWLGAEGLTGTGANP